MSLKSTIVGLVQQIFGLSRSGTSTTVTGTLVARQAGGTAGTDEVQIGHTGTFGFVLCMDGPLQLGTSARQDMVQLSPSGLDRIYINAAWLSHASFEWYIAGAGSGGLFQINLTGQFGWTATANAYEALDTSFVRLAAGVSAARDGQGGAGWVQNSAGRARVDVASPITNATITPAAITGLSRTLKAGRKYTGEMALWCSEVTAADGLRLDFDGGTATATSFIAQGVLSDDTSVRQIARVTALATDITETTITGNTFVRISLDIAVNAAGTFIPRFAKEADAAGAALTITAGYLWLEDTP